MRIQTAAARDGEVVLCGESVAVELLHSLATFLGFAATLIAFLGLPLVVVAPTSTLDPATASGADIPIEERDPAEVTARFPARNPAFDMTPAALVSAIVTERGVHRPPYTESLPRKAAAAR